MKLELITSTGEEKTVIFKEGITKSQFFKQLLINNIDLKVIDGYSDRGTWSSFTSLYPIADYFNITD